MLAMLLKGIRWHMAAAYIRLVWRNDSRWAILQTRVTEVNALCKLETLNER